MTSQVERPANGLQGSDRSLLIVYSDPDPSTKRAKAAAAVWRRIVSRTFDKTLNRYLSANDFEVISTNGRDDAAGKIRERVREGDVGCVLAVGEQAFLAASGHSHVLKLRGYGIRAERTVVVGTYGAEYILAGKYHLARIVQTDLLKGLAIARDGVRVRERSYRPHPTPEDAATFYQEWTKAGRPPLAFDIETPYSSKKDEGMTFEEDDSYTILMVAFAYRECEAISMPWFPPYTDIAKALLADAPQTLVWNAKFDVPRLMANGCEFGGEIIDAMVAWHWLEPSLPMGLKFVAPFLCPDMDAWALGKESDMALYNCGDADVLLRAFNSIRTKLVEQQRWGVFERHFLQFGKILTRMTKRGINVDLETRRASREEFQKEFEQVVREAQLLSPNEVRSVHPKKGYKKDEAALRKSGVWVDGEMRLIDVEISEEEAAKEEEKAARKAERERAKEEKAKRRALRKQKELTYG